MEGKMKRTIGIYLCLLFAICLIGCGSVEQDNENVIKTGRISNNGSIELVLADDSGKVWLDESHLEYVNMKLNEEGENYLEIVATEEGKKCLYEATKANLDKVLTFYVDGICIPTLNNNSVIEDGIIVIDNIIYCDPNYTFNLLTDASDKMKDVNPPKYIITEEEVKELVFNKAEVASEDITGLELELFFNEEWRGWQYNISFDANEKNYSAAVNAVTGTIISYRSN